jgi:hypothetical protein
MNIRERRAEDLEAVQGLLETGRLPSKGVERTIGSTSIILSGFSGSDRRDGEVRRKWSATITLRKSASRLESRDLHSSSVLLEACATEFAIRTQIAVRHREIYSISISFRTETAPIPGKSLGTGKVTCRPASHCSPRGIMVCTAAQRIPAGCKSPGQTWP